MLLDSPVIDRIVAADAEFTRFNSVRALRREHGRFEQRRFGAAVAMRDVTRDDLYYNRIVGLGEGDLDRLAAMVDFHQQIGKRSAITLTPDRANPAVVAALAGRGFALARYDCLFACVPQPAGLAPQSATIRRAGLADLDAVFDIWSEPYPEPVAADVRESRKAAQLTDEFPIYVGEEEGRIVAMATMYLSNGLAWLGNAGTLAKYRRHGHQLALLRHRLAEAARRGCELAVTDTDYGTASHRNVVRAGMAMAFTMNTLSLPPR